MNWFVPASLSTETVNLRSSDFEMKSLPDRTAPALNPTINTKSNTKLMSLGDWKKPPLLDFNVPSFIGKNPTYTTKELARDRGSHSMIHLP